MDLTCVLEPEPLLANLQSDKPPKRYKTIKDILQEFGPYSNIQFEPFKPEPSQPAEALLPPTFPTNPTLFDFFTLFFTPELFQIITTNTNKYTNLQQYNIQEEQQKWVNMVLEELYVFIGVIIYMRIHKEPQIPSY